MVRDIERTAIFRDDADRADFIGRLAALLGTTGLTAAWASSPTTPISSSGRPPPAPGVMRAVIENSGVR